jgi:hypothetical protein
MGRSFTGISGFNQIKAEGGEIQALEGWDLIMQFKPKQIV